MDNPFETEHALMQYKKPNTNYGSSMTRMMQKLKALKKKIAERHTNKPEEDEAPINKKDPEKDR